MANRFNKTSRAQQGILNLIARDGMTRGDRLPSEKDLEADIGVSIITVRRALAELARRGLIQRIQGKGTFLSQDVGQERIWGRIALLLVDRPSARYEGALELARRTARQRGYEMDLVTAGPRPDSDVTAQLQDVHGVIISGRPDDVWMEWLEMMHLPSVVLGVHRLALPAWQVQHDFTQAVSLAVSALADRGCRRIGLINAAPRYVPAHQIYAGYGQSMARLDLPWSDDHVIWCSHDEPIRDLTRFFHSRRQPYDGLVVEYGVLRALLMCMYEQDLNGARPQLALVGGEHIDAPAGLSRLVSIQFESGIARAAVELLFDAMSADESSTRTVLIPPLPPVHPAPSPAVSQPDALAKL